MSREIKFRIWDKIIKQMSYLNNYILEWNKFGASSDSYIDESVSPYPIDENECVLMQFTGLQDKNGNDIYEGDIVKICSSIAKDDPSGHYEPIGVVVFDDGCYLIEIDNDDNMQEYLHLLNVEVIGNIYENPELLK